MKKLLASAMMFTLFVLGTQESFAKRVKSINSFMSIETDESVKDKGVFSKKNKALTTAISEFKKRNKLLKNGKEKLLGKILKGKKGNKRTEGSDTSIKNLCSTTDEFLALFDKYFKEEYGLKTFREEMQSWCWSMRGCVNDVITNGLTSKDKSLLNDWRVAFRNLSKVLLNFDEITKKTEKTINKVDGSETPEIDIKKAMNSLNHKLDDFFDEDQSEDDESDGED